MGIFTKVEDRPTPPSVYNWRVYGLAAVAGSSAFIGTTLSLDSFKNEFGFKKMTTAHVNLLSANIVSCYQAGAFFGALFAYIAAFFTGRVSGLFIFSIIFTLGAGLMLGANGERGLGLIYAGRVLAGIGVGGASNLAPSMHILSLGLYFLSYLPSRKPNPPTQCSSGDPIWKS
jgi:MFS family permease